MSTTDLEVSPTVTGVVSDRDMHFARILVELERMSAKLDRLTAAFRSDPAVLQQRENIALMRNKVTTMMEEGN